MTSSPIWCLHNSERALLLYQGNDSQYFVTVDGAWSPILFCPLFTVVNEELLSFFKRHAYPLESHPVFITDRVLNKTFAGYHRIYIKDEITPQSMNAEDASGIKIWRFNGAIFVSETLKELLEQANISGIMATPGFSGWG